MPNLPNLPELEGKLNYQFTNIDYLKQALTHDSLRVLDPHLKDYQRWEFLGDSVIQLVVSDYLFTTDPDSTEGELTQKRTLLVGRTKQKEIAAELQLELYIYKAPGATISRYDRFLESIVGAVYKDALEGGRGGSGEVVKKLVYNLWKFQLPPAPAAEEVGGTGSQCKIA